MTALPKARYIEEPAPEFGLIDNAEDHKTYREPKSIPTPNIEGGELLADLKPEVILAQMIEIEHHDSKSTWKYGYCAYRLWVTGEFRSMVTKEDNPDYFWSREGFYEFLHDHGSHLSTTEISARQKVFGTFKMFPKEIAEKVERVGVSKARAAIKHVEKYPEKVLDILEWCAKTPYYHLADVLNGEFPVDKKKKDRKTEDQLRNDEHVRCLRTIGSVETGKIGGILPENRDEWMAVMRRFRLCTAQEFLIKQVFDEARAQTNYSMDRFMLEVAEIVAEKWLKSEDFEHIKRRAKTFPQDNGQKGEEA